MMLATTAAAAAAFYSSSSSSSSSTILCMIKCISGRLKVSITCFSTSSAGFSSAGAGFKKAGTHYDTLEISPNATQNEIKSAYYKLTMRYHPDKNKSRAAKEKFQDISNAYSVLGNHNSRKDYDRKMLIKYGNTSRAVYPNERAPDYAARYHPTAARAEGANVMYNIDRWTRMHYEYSFDRMQKIREVQEKYPKANVRERATHEEEYTAKRAFLRMSQGFVCYVVILLGCVLYVNVSQDPAGGEK